MAANMSSLERETITQSFRVVQQRVQLLMKVWKTFFDDICYRDYMTSLPASIGMFLNEIFYMTVVHCARKIREIRELQAEVDELRGILGATSPNDGWEDMHMSLDRRSVELHQMLDTLRNQAVCRKRQLDEYVEEQTILCNELGYNQPDFRRFTTSGEGGLLPDEQEMALFAEYMESLRQEKETRTARVHKMQENVRKLAMQLDWLPTKANQRKLMYEHNLAPTTQNITDLEQLYGVLYKLRQGKRLLQLAEPKQQVTLPVSQSPPPPPPSPELESAVSSSTQQTQPQTETAPSQPYHFDGLCKSGLLEVNIHTYRKMLTESGCDLSREEIMKHLFRNLQSNISLWWDRCLISSDERAQWKLHHINKQDDAAVQAHIDQQDLLKGYYYANELMFQLIYRWSETWSKYLLLERTVRPTIAHRDTDRDVRRQLEDTLAALEAQLKEKCDEFELRAQVEFTMFGLPVMYVLNTFKEKREDLNLPEDCVVLKACGIHRPPRIERSQLSMDSTLGLNLMLANGVRQGRNTLTSRANSMAPEPLFGNCVFENDISLTHADENFDTSDGEADETRDDELLEEAFASASALSNKGQVRSVNGARPKAGQTQPKTIQGRRLSSHPHRTNEAAAHSSLVPLNGNGRAMKQTKKNRKRATGALPTEAMQEEPLTSPFGTNDSAACSMPPNATAAVAITSTVECGGSKKLRSKSKKRKTTSDYVII